ncbi:MAG: hypothetical protein ACKVUS_15980 [Saprospiraceae bacterium]
MPPKRLRIFAGPNGSGKSTLVKHVTEQFHLNYGFFVNADEIERAIRAQGFFDCSPCGIQLQAPDLQSFLQNSAFIRSRTFPEWRAEHNKLFLTGEDFNSYHAALFAGFLREQMLEAGFTFSTETVMSAPQKLDMMRHAKELGFRVYLYYVATETPLINQVRVQNRVKLGGHDVPVDKIHNRYFRSLELLYDAIKISDRAYLFDNTEELTWVAEIANGHELILYTEEVPGWFVEYIEQKILDRRAA